MVYSNGMVATRPTTSDGNSDSVQQPTAAAAICNPFEKLLPTLSHPPLEWDQRVMMIQETYKKVINIPTYINDRQHSFFVNKAIENKNSMVVL